jgi:hypothetical protein
LDLARNEFRGRATSLARVSVGPEESQMTGYVFCEYPKWVAGGLVQNAAEEQAHRTALKGATSAAIVQAASPPNTAEIAQLETVRARIVELLANKTAAVGNSPIISGTSKVACRPSPAAIRMRRSRKRRHDKLMVVPFEIRTDEINGLVTRGLLDPVARNDRNEIANALGRLFDVVPPQRWPVPAVR